MTDYFIVAFDSDKAGDTGYESAKKKLKGTVVRLQIYKGDKDVGVLEETESPSDYDRLGYVGDHCRTVKRTYHRKKSKRNVK